MSSVFSSSGATTAIIGSAAMAANSNAIFYVGWPERFHMAERYTDEVLILDPELTDSDKLLLGTAEPHCATAALGVCVGLAQLPTRQTRAGVRGS